MKNIKNEIKGLIQFIRDEVNGAGKTGCVVGVSGGIDSAVIACLCKKAFSKTTYGISMPRWKENHKISFDGDSSKRAEELCKVKKIPLFKSPIVPSLHPLRIKDVNYFLAPNEKAEGNVHARLRMINLYYLAEHKNSLVIGTDNLSENFIGYFTKYGDGGCDINPIGQYTKREVYELEKALGVTKAILNAKPSAELWEGQTDEGEMGFSYDDLERVIFWYIKMNGNFVVYRTNEEISKITHINLDIVNKIIKMHCNTEHKRRVPNEYIR